MPVNGVMVVDKPVGWTSHDVVARVRRIAGERSVGHLGTLDPMATGVLPLVMGRMTRLCQFYAASEKAYEGTIRLGVATDTYDCDGDRVGEPQIVNVTIEEVRTAASGFCGLISQVPPPFSAKKIKGVPAYKLARRKQEVELQPVEVEVKELTVLGLDGDLIEFRCRVSSGTYVRSLAHELGQKLGIGAHLASLRRTAVAEFLVDQSHTLEAVAEAASQGRIGRVLDPSQAGFAGNPVRNGRRRGDWQNQARPHRESTGDVPLTVGEGVRRSVRVDLRRQPGGRDAVPSQGGLVELGPGGEPSLGITLSR